jgi:hypothetical protein
LEIQANKSRLIIEEHEKKKTIATVGANLRNDIIQYLGSSEVGTGAQPDELIVSHKGQQLSIKVRSAELFQVNGKKCLEDDMLDSVLKFFGRLSD